MDPAFFGRKVVPLGGQHRPPAALVYARGSFPVPERLPDGRYIVRNWMRNRCENLVQVGATTIYVVNDYGWMVPVHSWDEYR